MIGGYAFIDRGLSNSIVKTINAQPSEPANINYKNAFELLYQAIKTNKVLIIQSDGISLGGGATLTQLPFIVLGSIITDSSTVSITLEIASYVITVSSSEPNKYMIMGGK